MGHGMVDFLDNPQSETDWRPAPEARRPRPVAALQSGPTLQPIKTKIDFPAAPQRLVQLGAKRIFDIVACIVLLAMIWPAMLALAGGVALAGPGPVIFRQSRSGLNNRPFVIYKFRTLDTSGRPASRFCAFMRRTGLDELPQLANIVRGEMSLIGPRPHELGMRVCGTPYDAISPHYGLRTRMRPGLTGWAQANGLRGPLADPEIARSRIDYDLAYIENFSLALDARIVWLTLRHELPRGLRR